MIQKRILVAERLRRPPATGWSWVDRRFLREHGDYLSREAILLYLFLAAVADRHGLSFYSDSTLSGRLRLPQPAVEKAREELLRARSDRPPVAIGPGAVAACAWGQPACGAGPRADAARRRVPPTDGRTGSRPREGQAMKVALWAEIRRLAEIDKLSSRARSRGNCTARGTPWPPPWTKQQPPAQQAARRASLLDAVRGADPGAVGQVSRPVGRAHPRGDRPRTAGLHRAAPAPCAVTCVGSGRHAAASTRRCIINPARPCRSIGANAAGSRWARPRARSRCSWPCSAIAACCTSSSPCRSARPSSIAAWSTP